MLWDLVTRRHLARGGKKDRVTEITPRSSRAAVPVPEVIADLQRFENFMLDRLDDVVWITNVERLTVGTLAAAGTGIPHPAAQHSATFDDAAQGMAAKCGSDEETQYALDCRHRR